MAWKIGVLTLQGQSRQLPPYTATRLALLFAEQLCWTDT